MSNPRVPIFGMAAAALALTAALSCGGSSSSPSPPSGGCTPSANPNTLVIMNNSICPQTLTVTRGSQLTIMNQDSNTHEMNSDPHPEHTDCPEIDIGFLATGQSRSSNNLNIARRCGIHDHNNSTRDALKATITIQ
jgi:hypothetical protein